MNDLKIGVISYERKKLITEKGSQNMGDWIQTISMEKLLSELGITNYKYISRNTASKYNGETVFVPVNGVCYGSDIYNADRTDSWSEKIIPFFWSFHCTNEYISDELKCKLMQYSPIGCRDEATMKKLQGHGIPAFVTGCVSALIDKRSDETASQADEIFFIDTPKEILKYVPEEILNKAQFKTNVFSFSYKKGRYYTTDEEAFEAYEHTKKVYEYYKNHAALIVTSRLHIASPCTAMGIPVILVDNKNIDGRFTWIDKLLPIYYKEDFNKINWQPLAVDYEEEKKAIKNIFKTMFTEAYDKYNRVYKLNCFFGNSSVYPHNKAIRMKLTGFTELFRNKSCNYVIWGVREPITDIMDYITSELPGLKLTAVYDKLVKGYFEGSRIMHPRDITAKDNTVYILLSRAMREDPNFKKIEDKPYVIFDRKSDDIAEIYNI